MEQVRVLDGLVRYDFGSNPELMGAWGSARNVPGPFRSKVIETPLPSLELLPDLIESIRVYGIARN